MVIISTSAVEVSIHAVLPVSSLASSASAGSAIMKQAAARAPARTFQFFLMDIGFKPLVDFPLAQPRKAV